MPRYLMRQTRTGFATRTRHAEGHRTGKVGWLRAAVLGANDGIISTASLVVGVATARPDAAVTAAVAGLVAGALSMAAGEYVSVSSEADAEQADLKLEQWELEHQREFELEELAAIYHKRGLTPALAREVATQLMAKDALAAHARDELGISDAFTQKPLVAALASALMFSVGALLPLVTLLVSPAAWVIPLVAGSTLVFLAGLGAAAAIAGGASPSSGALRVAFWGAVAMGFSAAVGKLFGVAA